MSGGSGPIDKKCAEGLLQCDREVALCEDCGVIDIYKNLSMNRVYYFPKRQSLYFVESTHSTISAVIDSVSEGLKKPFIVEQLYLDQHRYFRGPLRMVVNETDARTLLVAFRLNQILVDFSQ